MAGSHSLLSPSSADRWTRCPGSVQLCKDIPNLPSEASALGSAKHETQYWCLMHTNPLKTASGLQGQPWTHENFAGTIDDEFVEHVNYCLTAIRAIPGDLRLFEIKLDTSPILGVPDQSGTADVIIGDRAKRILHVGDSKFGYGYVEVEHNRQMLVYGGAALHCFDEFGVDYDEVWLWIFQPKRGEPRVWKTTPAFVRAAVEDFAEMAQIAVIPDTDPVLTPGDQQCQWCPARASCKARNDAILTAYPIETLKVEGVVHTEDDLAVCLGHADFLESWCRDIRAEALKRAMSGRQIPGYKLIEGKRGNRRWSDTSIAERELKDLGVDPHDHKLVSPTEAQRRLKAAGKSYEDVAWNVEQPPGAPSLAKWSEEGKPLPVLEFGLDEAQ